MHPKVAAVEQAAAMQMITPRTDGNNINSMKDSVRLDYPELPLGGPGSTLLALPVQTLPSARNRVVRMFWPTACVAAAPVTRQTMVEGIVGNVDSPVTLRGLGKAPGLGGSLGGPEGGPDA